MDEFLARSGITKCGDFKETVDVITKLAFKLFLGFSPSVTNWSSDGKECCLVFEDNPLVEFVELDESTKSLSYCQIYCGIIRGALEMVSTLG